MFEYTIGDTFEYSYASDRSSTVKGARMKVVKIFGRFAELEFISTTGSYVGSSSTYLVDANGCSVGGTVKEYTKFYLIKKPTFEFKVVYWTTGGRNLLYGDDCWFNTLRYHYQADELSACYVRQDGNNNKITLMTLKEARKIHLK